MLWRARVYTVYDYTAQTYDIIDITTATATATAFTIHH
jgi:hypothetical protein